MACGWRGYPGHEQLAPAPDGTKRCYRCMAVKDILEYRPNRRMCRACEAVRYAGMRE